MIQQLTDGDICYGQPVNFIGLTLTSIIGLILWDLVKYLWRIR